PRLDDLVGEQQADRLRDPHGGKLPAPLGEPKLEDEGPFRRHRNGHGHFIAADTIFGSPEQLPGVSEARERHADRIGWRRLGERPHELGKVVSRPCEVSDPSKRQNRDGQDRLTHATATPLISGSDHDMRRKCGQRRIVSLLALANRALPYRTLPELVAYAKSRP